MLCDLEAGNGPSWIVFIDDSELNLKFAVDLCEAHFGSRYGIMGFISEDEAAKFIIDNAGDIAIVSSDETHIPGAIISNWARLKTGFDQTFYPDKQYSSFARVHYYLVDSFVPEAGMLSYSGGGSREFYEYLVEWETVADEIAFIQKPISVPRFVEKVGRLLKNYETQFSEPSADSLTIAPVNDELVAVCGARPDFIDRVTPRQFEEMVASIMTNNGLSVELTPVTRDGGYDIKAVSGTGFEEEVSLVEVKRFHPERPVSVGIVRSLYGVKSLHCAHKAVLVTSSYVSEYAKKEFSRCIPHELEIWERKEIEQFCRAHLKKVVFTG